MNPLNEPAPGATAASGKDAEIDHHYRLLIEAVHDYAIFMLDPSGNVASWNTGAERIKGYPPEEIIGRSFAVFYTPKDVAAGKPAHELAIAAAEGHAEDEGWRVRRDGSRFWANVIISAVHDASGTLIGFAKVTRDMTERRRLTELEHAREVSTQNQTARENEQKRIARELHDDLGQQLTALKMSVALLDARLQALGVSKEPLQETHELHTQIDAMATSLRRIAADLRPPLLDDLGLVAALEWMFEDFTRRYGVQVSARLVDDDLVFTEFAATAIFRIVQEALTNIARHAEANHVAVELIRAHGMCSIDIADDGVGVDLDEAPRQKSFGLLGIRERVSQLNGTVSFHSAAGSGFRIAIQIPESMLTTDHPA